MKQLQYRTLKKLFSKKKSVWKSVYICTTCNRVLTEAVAEQSGVKKISLGQHVGKLGKNPKATP